MTGRRKTPLQRAGSRQAAEPDQDSDEFRNMMRRRQDAEEKLRRHLEGERDGRPIEPAAGDQPDDGPSTGESSDPLPGHDDGT